MATTAPSRPTKSYPRLVADVAFFARQQLARLDEARGQAPAEDLAELDQVAEAIVKLELWASDRAKRRSGLARQRR